MAKTKKQEIPVGNDTPSAVPAVEPDAFTQFVTKIIQVPKTEIDRREEEYKKSRKSKRTSTTG